jgi:hypothetical protein
VLVLLFALQQSIALQKLKFNFPDWGSLQSKVNSSRDTILFDGSTDTLDPVVISNDHILVASGSEEGMIRIRNVVTGIKSLDANSYIDVSSLTDIDLLLVVIRGRSNGFLDCDQLPLTNSDTDLGHTEVAGEVDGKLGFGISYDNDGITAARPT